MAEKKTTKKSTKKQAAKELSNSSKRQLYAILFLALGVIVTAVTIVPGESLWNTFHDMLLGLFGWCAYLVGPVLIVLAVINTMEKPLFSTTAQGIEIGILILVLSGITTVFASEGMELDRGFFKNIAELYAKGKEIIGGGVLSGVFGLTGLKLLGKTPAIIVGIVLILVLLLLITGTTLIGIARNTKKVGKKVKEVYTEQVEHHKEVVEARPRNVAIDIPIDDTSARPQKADKVKASKAKLLGEEPKPEVPEQPQRSTIDIPLDDEVKKPEIAEKEAPICGFKAARTVEVKASQEISLENVKSTEEQMEDAAKDPQLEALINRAMEQTPADTKAAKEAARAIAEEEQKKITEIMDDLETLPYTFPPEMILKEVEHPDERNVTEELRQNADLLVTTLQSFGVQAKVIDISRGPAVTRYELQPGAGVKISKIAGLSDDIALNLAAAGVRIEAPIPNKAAVGIEVPNRNVSVVSIREVIDSEEFRKAKSKLTVALGRDITGKIALADLAKMPHLLIAGSTGSGKSVCINTMIMSLLYKSSPDEVKLLMVDPKVVELGVYNGIPHLLVPVVTDPRKAAGALNWAVSEMLNRYKSFADNGVRDITGFNELANKRDDLARMPQVVIIIDELADLMMAAPGEVEDAVCRLAQMARAAGMHLVIATQRPSVDVITGLIKANIPSRIAFAVSSHVDSRTILDTGGAEKLLGRGDMLFAPVGSPKPSRIQGCFVSDREVEDVVHFIKDGGTAVYDEEILDDIEKLAAQEKGKKGSSADVENDGGGFSDEDDMLPAAIECVIEMGQASTSLLQRKLKLGYARAARIIDQMEERGVVGPFEGSKPRQVLMTKEEWLEKKLQSDEE